MPANQKLIRWIDLLAALLRRRFAVSFEELARDVPAYAHAGHAGETLLRMFERDKDELRRAGIPIETVTGADGEPSQYALSPHAFYLPYLVLAGVERPAPVRPVGIGFGSLATLPLAPEEAAMLRRAAERAAALGAPPLTADATSALRKLRFDLPEELALPEPARPVADGAAFEALMDATTRAKRVRFTYHSFGRDATSVRDVEPYGLVYLTGHWYLVAREAGEPTVRLFRISRLREVTVNAKAPGTPDFTVPAHFHLRTWARSRQAWELGTGDTEAIDVRFRAQDGDLHRALQLGEPLATGDAESRRFRVRRRDTFLRWLLAFGGAAIPVAPADVVTDWQALVRDTLAVHRRAPEGT